MGKSSEVLNGQTLQRSNANANASHKRGDSVYDNKLTLQRFSEFTTVLASRLKTAQSYSRVASRKI